MSGVSESEPWFLSTKPRGNTVLNAGREVEAEPAWCFWALWEGKGNPHTKQAFGITVCVLNLHMPCSHWEPQMEADFITWKSPQVARKVAKNIASSLKTHYRKSNAENSLITLHPGSVYHTLNKLPGLCHPAAMVCSTKQPNSKRKPFFPSSPNSLQ